MKTKQIESMIYDLFSDADYDIAKQLIKETAEDPDGAEELMSGLVVIAKSHMEDLLKDSRWLSCLEAAGVDNWDGISYAHELLDD